MHSPLYFVSQRARWVWMTQPEVSATVETMVKPLCDNSDFYFKAFSHKARTHNTMQLRVFKTVILGWCSTATSLLQPPQKLVSESWLRRRGQAKAALVKRFWELLAGRRSPAH
jgi:hypothetical protein